LHTGFPLSSWPLYVTRATENARRENAAHYCTAGIMRERCYGKQKKTVFFRNDKTSSV